MCVAGGGEGGAGCVPSIVKLKSPKPSIITLWTIHGQISNAVFYHHESFVEETETQKGLGTSCRHVASSQQSWYWNSNCRA